MLASVSIILCTHRSDRYENFEEALNSLDAQSYNNLEIIVVVDGNRERYDRIVESGIEDADKVQGKGKVKVILNEKNLGRICSILSGKVKYKIMHITQICTYCSLSHFQFLDSTFY